VLTARENGLQIACRSARVPARCASVGQGLLHEEHQLSRETDTSRPKRFSMIREFHFADWFTLANAICGTGAVLTSMTYLETGDVTRIYLASGAILAALVFDVLDGRIARWRQTSSALGRELDSLADVISFGVAPAALAYACGMQGFLDRVILAYFVACGVSRLARYNVTAEALSGGSGKVAYFEGTPIPTSIVLVAMLAIAAWSGALGERMWLGEVEIAGLRLHWLALAFAVSGSLMISRIRIPKL
jgi:CDP-diacylglycerol---serine O-phosphatidyltransferase